MTLAPASRKRPAMARPIPRLAPVITAVLPSSVRTGSIAGAFHALDPISSRDRPRCAVASSLVNHLADETSPYLRQHADNPVEWFPWGDDALQRAKDEDKPIFLSIGYASCHWCHVMAHESFEDEATAADLSRWFISVKVDREERPDLDSLYMAATQAFTGSGGWPMSVFCTPDGRPFYAGTYFPPEDRHGMPAFRRVVEALGQRLGAGTRRRAGPSRRPGRCRTTRSPPGRIDVGGQVRPRVRVILHPGPGIGPVPVPVPALAIDADALIERVVASLQGGFDPQWGGFGPAPKFPRPSLVELCLRHHRRTGSERSRQMALTTLDGMAAGGMYDHLVGGFCRYSTDDRWLVPHFEKMLTDQALLARAYLHAWQETGRENYLTVVTETLDFVLRDLSTPEGALFSSFDADAGGVEGSHATFTLAELETDAPRAPGPAHGRVVRHHARGQLGRTVHPLSSGGRAPGSARPKSKRLASCWPRCGPIGCSRPETRRCSPSGTPWRPPRWPR